MTTRRLAGLAVAAACLGAGCGPSRSGEESVGPPPKTPAPVIPPRTDGRGLEQWAARLSDPDAAGRRDALEALAVHAGSAVEYVDAVGPCLADPDPAVRWAAAELVGRIGAPAGAHADALVRLLDDPVGGVRRAAARAAGQVPATAPALVERLRSDDARTRALAKAPLLLIAPAAADPAALVPRLASLLAPDDPARAEDAADVLAALGPAGVPPLAAALAHEDGFVVVLAAGGLARIGPAAAAAVDALAATVRGRRGDGRVHALEALVAVGAPARAALTALAASRDAGVSSAATDALARLR
jgi:HEAT repeat protein